MVVGWWAARVVVPAWVGLVPLDPVAVRVGPLQVRWYGLLIALAFLPGWLLARPEMARLGLGADDLMDGLAMGIPLALAGARLAFVGQNLDYFAAHPHAILRTWEGGLSIHGALAGVGLAVVLLARRTRVAAAGLADLAAPSLLLGQAIGRWGNFFNREVLGYPTAVPWKLYVPPELRPPAFAGEAFFHPAFLYESLLNLAAAGALVAWRRRRRGWGEVAALYLILYSANRFVVEFVRIGQPAALGLTLAQWVSLALALAGGVWMAAVRLRPKAVACGSQGGR